MHFKLFQHPLSVSERFDSHITSEEGLVWQ